MRTVASLLNRSEERVLQELQSIASDNGLRVFAKLRLSDVIEKGSAYLLPREFDFYTRSHCDFVVTDSDGRPMMVVEYDGPIHNDPKQQERDRIKNDLCKRAELGLLRINDRHVTKLYRGMTVLRWIIEVTELQKAFYEWQSKGHIPADEPFDPAFLEPSDGKRRFPYWLSSDTTQAFHSFFRKLDPAMPKGLSSVVGHDGNGVDYRLSCLYFGKEILWAKTAVRNQDLDFPHYDLLNELDTCELGIRFSNFRKGEIRSVSAKEFRAVFEHFCEKYNAHPSSMSGGFPFSTRWSFQDGWQHAQASR